MLYVTTRNNCDTHTAPKALHQDRGEDGGLYLPFQSLDLTQISVGGNAAIAQVLGLLFQKSLDKWDVDFAVGRYPVGLQPLRPKTMVAELWHNPKWSFDWTVRQLAALLTGQSQENPSDFLQIAVRIAILTGIFGDLKAQGMTEPLDIALVSGDFSAPISAWYARAWGLPIGDILCCCNENNSLWDLLAHGQLRPDTAPIPTSLPEGDVVVPRDLERLIYEAGGVIEVEDYLECCRRGRMYCPEEEAWEALRQGLVPCVVSSQRLDRTIRGAYDTHKYLLSPASALAYGGLQDHRAKSGAIRPTLVVTESSPRCHAQAVAQALGIGVETLKKLL